MNRPNRSGAGPARWITPLSLAAALLFVAGCASAGSSLPDGIERGPSDRIIQEEIAYWSSQGVRDVYELVDRARPRWYRTTLGGQSVGTGQTATTVTYRDQNHLGGLEELRREPLDGIAYVEWLSASEADMLPGARDVHINGAIRIVTTASGVGN